MLGRRAMTVLGVMSLTACGILSPGEDGELTKLRRAEALWAAHGPTHYRVTAERLCFCPVIAARITVNDGVITEVDFPDGVDPPENEEWWRNFVMDYYLPVADVFPYLRDVLANDPHRFEAEYRTTDGLPLSVSVDQMRDAVDDEWALHYGDLEPLGDGST